ncbi:MAG: glycosyl transferase group 1 [Ferruginibacter sp.]|nr:glycosyl transferase group 1 [Ferruginibacter sp.]
MKILFYQSRRETFSINLLFDVIRQNLPKSLEPIIVTFTHKGSSFLNRVFDIISVAWIQKQGEINHVVGDFNYATFLMRKNKTIMTIHDLGRIYIYKNSPVKKFIVKWFWLWLPISKAVVITAVSRTTKEEILKYVNCPPDKIRVIYNCISPRFNANAKVFNKEKPVLLQIGTRPNKNLQRVIEAVAGISCKLDIVGSLNAETIRLLNHHHIDFTCKSNLTNEEVRQKYINADMLIFVSLFEGFGMPIVEANAVERAVVTSNCSAMAEIAGNAACLVNPNVVESIREGIIRVINDDEYRQYLINNGRINKKRFDATKITREYFSLYNEVYAKAPVRRKWC